MDRARGGASLAPPRLARRARSGGGPAGPSWTAGILLIAWAVVAAPAQVRVEILQRFVAPSGLVWWAVRLTNIGSAPLTIVDIIVQADGRQIAATPSGRTLPAFLDQGGRLGPGEAVSGPVGFAALGAASQPEGPLAVRYRDDAGLLHRVELPLRVGASSESAP